MRPPILYSFLAPVTSLRGVGGFLGTLLKRLVGDHIRDVAFHLPSGVERRQFYPSISQAIPGGLATLKVTPTDYQPGRGNSPFRVYCVDADSPSRWSIDLVFFKAKGSVIETQLPLGQPKIISGQLERFHGGLQIVHPDHVGPLGTEVQWQGYRPLYPLTTGLSHKTFIKFRDQALQALPSLAEWIDSAFKSQEKWESWADSLRHTHAPQSIDDLSPLTPYRRRLAYDELLAHQLGLQLIRRSQKQLGGRSLVGNGALTSKLLQALPFQLTNAQQHALKEIEEDMAAPNRMVRLLQGDVGSGKTIVAFLSMLRAIEQGSQAVLLAPTEILARQHAETLTQWGTLLGLEVELLTGRIKGKKREEIQTKITSGTLKIVVGTHALFQDDVVFQDLAFIVIDEQHRFGIDQRLSLTAKGKHADLLVMSATPIPRTLLLASYGDMACSRILEKPVGRKPIVTKAMPLTKGPQVVEGLKRALSQGSKAYWICPLIEESETLDLAAATDRLQSLRKELGDQVGLIHGRMKGDEKEAVMASFADPQGPIKVLVSTTVVEVGVDVKDATIMVIEHSERFGLAQLHQLRGRIGRNSLESTCLLLYAEPLGEIAAARLKALKETNDGFKIAEEDLKLRGAGELLGKRQSGMVTYQLANLMVHQDLLQIAHDDARLILHQDPNLETPRGQALRTLLFLFGLDQVVRYLRSG